MAQQSNSETTPKSDERFARQYRYRPPPEFTLALPRSGIVNHLSSLDRFAHTRTLLRRSRGCSPLGPDVVISTTERGRHLVLWILKGHQYWTGHHVSVQFSTITRLLVHPTSLVLLTKNSPLGALDSMARPDKAVAGPIPKSEERFAYKYRYGHPPEFPLASPRSGIVHHLLGPDRINQVAFLIDVGVA
ncbi:hypothetical protein BC332_33849 [Capsicum chinense]|nr:hypothetical protein BC332_33849 [Capsicum chinense]